jgi:hypothetical protein
MSSSLSSKSRNNKNDVDVVPFKVSVEENLEFAKSFLSTVTDNLETYQGRDTVITLTLSISLVIADICTYFDIGTESKLSLSFVNMFQQLSMCRVMLRLFDDFAIIRELYRFNKIKVLYFIIKT